MEKDNKINKVVLSIDSSTLSAGVALTRGYDMIGEVNINSKKAHSERLMPLIERLFQDCEMTMKDVDVIGVTSGPGSFTGIRIGLATVKGLALPFEIPVCKVSSLEALALSHYGYGGLVCPMLDARRDQVFTAIYGFEEGRLIRLTEEMSIHPLELGEIIKALAAVNPSYKSIILNGDSATKYFGVIEDTCSDHLRVEISSPANMSIRASNLAFAMLIESSEEMDFRDLDANYIRQSEAEETKKRKEMGLKKIEY